MKPRYACRWCGLKDYPTTRPLREHVRRHHPEVTDIELERHIVETRYPDLDMDAIVQRYVDRLETMIGLQYKGIFIKKYLQTLGVARHHQADKALMRFLKPEHTTPEDITKAMADELCHKFLKSSDEVRFNGYLNRDLAVLKNKGQEDLIPAIKALKLIKFTRKQLAAAIEDTVAEETDTENT